MNYASLLGTVSHGTLRTQDLIDAAFDAFDRVKDWRTTAGRPYDEPYEVRAVGKAEVAFARHERLRAELEASDQYVNWCEAESGTWASEYLTSVVDTLCPPGVYYGAIEGDGADIGFWLAEQEDENV